MLANIGFPPTQFCFRIFDLCGIMNTNVITGFLSGLGIFIFAGVSGFGFLLIFLWELYFSQNKHKYIIIMI